MNMFLIIATCLIVSVLIFFSKRRLRIFSTWDLVGTNIIGWVLSVLAVVLVQWTMSVCLPTEIVPSYKVKIMSVKNDKGTISDSFIFGSGSVNWVERYSYYREWGNGYKKENVRVAKSTIFEEDRVDAELVVTKEVFHSPWIRKHFEVIHIVEVGGGDGYEFHIPKGAVLMKFSVK